MGHSLRVKQGGSIIGPDHKTIYRGGQIIPDGVFTRQQAEEHIKSGYAEPVNVGTAPAADILTPNPPGLENKPPLKMDEGGSDNRKEQATIKLTTPPKAMVSHPVAQTEPQQTSTTPSPWTLDPASLAGQSLEALNVMVQERSKDVKPFETVEEAVAHLSQDFGK